MHHGDSHAAANPGPPGTEAEGERLDKWPALCVSCKSVSMTSWKSRAVLKLLKEREAASRWRLQKEHAVAPVKDFLQRDKATKGAVGSRGPAAERRGGRDGEAAGRRGPGWTRGTGQRGLEDASQASVWETGWMEASFTPEASQERRTCGERKTSLTVTHFERPAESQWPSKKWLARRM